jgi:hypothetical protein
MIYSPGWYSPQRQIQRSAATVYDRAVSLTFHKCVQPKPWCSWITMPSISLLPLHQLAKHETVTLPYPLLSPSLANPWMLLQVTCVCVCVCVWVWVSEWVWVCECERVRECVCARVRACMSCSSFRNIWHSPLPSDPILCNSFDLVPSCPLEGHVADRIYCSKKCMNTDRNVYLLKGQFF